MKKLIFFALSAILFLWFFITDSFSSHENKEELLLSQIYQNENYFNNRNGKNTDILIQQLIYSAKYLENQYPTKKNLAIYYGVVYGLGQTQYYNNNYIHNINNNSQQDFFIEHYCLIQPRSIINTINEQLKIAIDNSDDNSCKNSIKNYSVTD
jgi:hypothetical protein